jgi:hypothetical protein
MELSTVAANLPAVILQPKSGVSFTLNFLHAELTENPHALRSKLELISEQHAIREKLILIRISKNIERIYKHYNEEYKTKIISNETIASIIAVFTEFLQNLVSMMFIEGYKVFEGRGSILTLDLEEQVSILLVVKLFGNKKPIVFDIVYQF